MADWFAVAASVAPVSCLLVLILTSEPSKMSQEIRRELVAETKSQPVYVTEVAKVSVRTAAKRWGVGEELLDALTMTENPGRDAEAVGDLGLTHHAYGLLQIRKPYLDDVNRIVGKDVMAVTWGKKKLTMVDVKEEVKARWVAKIYLEYYGRMYRHNTGKAPTYEVYARMHNGGPDGWANRSTLGYWRKVSANLAVVRTEVAMADSAIPVSRME